MTVAEGDEDPPVVPKVVPRLRDDLVREPLDRPGALHCGAGVASTDSREALDGENQMKDRRECLDSAVVLLEGSGVAGHSGERVLAVPPQRSMRASIETETDVLVVVVTVVCSSRSATLPNPLTRRH